MILNCIRHYSFVLPVFKRWIKHNNPDLIRSSEFHTTCTAEMRFVQFYLVSDSRRVSRVGVQLDNNKLIDLSNLIWTSHHCRNLVESLQKIGGEGLMSFSKNILNSQHQEVQEEYKLLAPITKPEKLVCIGLNYRQHCFETNIPIPTEPVVFCKFPSSITGPSENIPYPEYVSNEVDWEVELAAVIGRAGKNIDVKDAQNYVFGYTIANDVTARDWQMNCNGGQWLLGKSMDGFCPLGPCIVTADEIGDPHNLNLSCRVNGVVKQDSNTNQLVHNVYDCIAWISRICTLLPGDVILTGTPSGVGFKASPPLFLKKGDVVECRIDKIGFIRNQIA